MGKKIPIYVVPLTDFLCTSACPFLHEVRSDNGQTECLLFHEKLGESRDSDRVYLRCDQCQNL
jgi:hypothetical protein